MSTPAFGRRANKSQAPKRPNGLKGPIGVMRKGTEGRMDKTEGRMRPGMKGQFVDPKQARLNALKNARNRYKEA